MLWFAKHLLLLLLFLVCASPVAFAEESAVQPKKGFVIAPLPTFFILFKGIVEGYLSASKEPDYYDIWENEEKNVLLQEDQQVLDALYNVLGHDNVYIETQNGRIDKLFINLFDDAEVFLLPEEITHLTGLRVLELHGIEYMQPLPDSLFAMPQLELLFLQNYNWPLPEDLSGLRSLRWLTFTSCGFKKLPDSIGKLDALQTLYISDCLLTSLPESLGSLQNLGWLSIDNTPLQSLPLSIGNMAALRGLIVKNTHIQALPEEIGKLQNLTDVYISGNRLKEIPASLIHCRNLQELDLGSNALTDHAYPIIAALPALKKLSLYGNNLSGSLPEVLFAMPHLEYLNLSGNNFSGNVPASFMESPKLEALILTGNPQLKGQMLPFMSEKKLNVLAIYNTSIAYAPDDEAFIAAKKTQKYGESKAQKRKLDMQVSLSFAPEKIDLFLVKYPERQMLTNGYSTIPLWGGNVSFSLSVYLPADMEATAESLQQVMDEVILAVENDMQKITAISAEKLLQKVIEVNWDNMEDQNTYGTLYDFGSYPIRTKADMQKYLHIEGIIVDVLDMEHSSILDIRVCMEENGALMDGFPVCVNLKEME